MGHPKDLGKQRKFEWKVHFGNSGTKSVTESVTDSVTDSITKQVTEQETEQVISKLWRELNSSLALTNCVRLVCVIALIARKALTFQ